MKWSGDNMYKLKKTNLILSNNLYCYKLILKTLSILMIFIVNFSVFTYANINSNTKKIKSNTSIGVFNKFTEKIKNNKSTTSLIIALSISSSINVALLIKNIKSKIFFKKIEKSESIKTLVLEDISKLLDIYFNLKTKIVCNQVGTSEDVISECEDITNSTLDEINLELKKYISSDELQYEDSYCCEQRQKDKEYNIANYYYAYYCKTAIMDGHRVHNMIINKLNLETIVYLRNKLVYLIEIYLGAIGDNLD